MPNEKFNWKSLFVNTEDDSDDMGKNETPEKKEEKPVRVNRFPTQDNFQTPPPLPTETYSPRPVESPNPSESQSNPFIGEVLDIYEKGFESLNMPGFDFFEFYNSVMAVELNPQSYQMAFKMGKIIQPNLSKDMLLEKAQYYISEIEKVYLKYEAAGNTKSTELDKRIQIQKENLGKQVAELEANIVRLQAELANKKAELSSIDTDKEQFRTIQLKIEANNFAKKKIINSINTVVTGIKQYL